MSLKEEAPPANSFVNPRKFGWLYKHGGSGVSSHWKKRWFVADNNYLFYYKNPSDKKPVGLLCLQDYLACYKSKDCKKPYSFVLDRGDAQAVPNHDNGKSYLLYTDSEKDMAEWIKAMTEEMKGPPTRQRSEKTIEKIDQKALEEVSKTIGDGPKLVHLTADRPKVKNRRPPLKKYTTFDEDDSKEEASEDDFPANSRKTPVGLQSSIKHKQPLLLPTKSIEDVEEPSGSPLHGHKSPLLPKGGSRMTIKSCEESEVTKVKPLPPPKKAQSDNQSTSTEGEPVGEHEGELELTLQTTPKVKPLPPPPPPKKIDTAVSTDSQIGVENKLSTSVGTIAEADTLVQATKSKPLPKKMDTSISIDTQANEPNTCTVNTNDLSTETNIHVGEVANKVKDKLKEECISENQMLELASTSEKLPLYGSDESHAESSASATSSKSKPEEISSTLVLNEAGSKLKPKPQPRKRAGKDQQDSLHTNLQTGSMAIETATTKPLHINLQTGSETATMEPLHTNLQTSSMVTETATMEPLHTNLQTGSMATETATMEPLHTNLQTGSMATETATMEPLHINLQTSSMATETATMEPLHTNLQTGSMATETATMEPLHTNLQTGSMATETATMEPLHTNLQTGSMATETATMEEPIVDSRPSKVCLEVATVTESENQTSNGSKETVGIVSVEQPTESKMTTQYSKTTLAVEPKAEDPLLNSSVSIKPELQASEQISTPDQDYTGQSSADKHNMLAPVHDEREVLVTSSQENMTSTNPEHVVSEQPKATSDGPLFIAEKHEKNTETVYDALSVRSDSSVVSSGPLERDSFGYTLIKKDGKGAVLHGVSDDVAEHAPSAVPKPSLPIAPQEERAPRVKEAYRMYETIDILQPNKPQSPSVADTIPLALKQAKEVLRLAQAIRAEADEMRKEAQREFELAKRDRYDAEIIKKNATEILKMAKEKLHNTQQQQHQ